MIRARWFGLLLVLLVAGSVMGADFWEKKTFDKWKEKEAVKILENSPWTYQFSWGHIGDIGRNMESPTQRTPQTSSDDTSTLSGDGPGESVASEREFIVFIRLQLFSSRPVRQALAVRFSKGDPARLERQRDFATRDFGDEIVISCILDSKPKGVSALVDLDAAFNALTYTALANNTFIATDRGKKVYIKDYIPPTKDGTGAKFVFPRFLEDGSPLIGPDVQSFRFQTIKFKIKDEEVAVDATYKISKMMFNGQVEY